MPLATRPNQTYEVTLSTDAKLPKPKRPVFIYRYLSVVEWEDITALSEKFDEATGAKEMIQLAFQVIEKTLCNWRNMKTPQGQQIAYNVKRLKSMVTLGEATELMQAAVSQRPAVPDKKKSDSRSRSSTAASAKAAGE